MPNFQGDRAVSDINSQVISLDFAKDIYNAELGSGNEAALFLLAGRLKGNKSVSRPDFKVAADTLLKRTTEIAVISAPTATSMTVTAGDAKLIRPREVLYNLQTNERYFVTNVNTATNVITVVRDFGTVLGAPSALTAVTDRLRILGPHREEGGGTDEPVSNQLDVSYNYVSYIRTPVGVTKHAKNTKTEFGSTQERDRKKALIQHRIQMNTDLWFGARATLSDPLTGNTIWTTGGVFQHLIGNVLSLATSGGVLSERTWDNFMEQAFLNGNSTKHFFCGLHFVSAISSFAKNKVRFRDDLMKKYGVSISEYTTANGKRLMIVEDHNVFEGAGKVSGVTGGSMASNGVVLDMDKVETVHLDGMATALNLNVQFPGQSVYLDEWESTIGLRMQPGIDDPNNAVAAPLQYTSVHAKITGFDTYS